MVELPARVGEGRVAVASPDARGRLFALVAVVLAMLVQGVAAAGEAGPEGVSIEHLPRPHGELGIADICCGADPGFVPLPGGALATRFGDTSQWLRITTDGRAGVLVLGALVDEADFYVRDPATGAWTVMRAGDMRPASERPLVSARIAFPLPATPQPAEFYLRVLQQTAVSVGVEFLSRDAFEARTQSTAVVRAALIGAVVVMILFNLTFSVATRDLAFLFNAAVITSILALDLYLTGVGSAHLWAELPQISNPVVNLSMLAICATGGLFFYFFLHEPGQSRQRVLLPLLAAPVGAVVIAAALPWVDYWQVQPPTFVLLVLMILVNLTVCLVEAWRGNRRARVLLVPFVGCMLPGAALTVAHVIFGYRIGGLDEHFLEATLVLEALLFSLALAYRIRIAQHERAEIQSELVRHIRGSERRLLSAVDRERSRIAADLHDTAGQGLVAIVSRLARLSHKLNGAAHVGPEIDAIADASRETVGEIRRISHNLHSATLSQLGLSRALDSLAEQIASGHSVAIDLEIDEAGEELPEEARLHVYRITQELLTNVVKHSDAAHCAVRLRGDGDQMVLEVTDDGLGMPQSNGDGQPGEGGSLGLELVAQRVRSLGGRWRVNRHAPGTAVEIRFPVAVN
jgi:signal transduction histidine kinase